MQNRIWSHGSATNTGDRTRRLYGILLIAATIMSACSVEADETLNVRSDELYVAGSKIWRTLRIPVCWENATTGDATERGWVRDIASTWETSSLVDFTEWDNCAAGDPGVHIRIEDTSPHVDALGRELNGRTDGMTLNFTFANWSPICQGQRRDCIEDIAVHEFGHALGFAHEQNRDDTPATCTDAPQGTDGDTTIGAWDLHSAMNYCNPTWNNDGNLSATDIVGVRQYYGSTTFAANRQDAVNWGNGKVYFFNGAEYTRYDEGTVATGDGRADSGYPLRIADHWHGFPPTWTDGVDAVVDWGNGKVYFFRDSQYARFDKAADRFDTGYPRTIAGNWDGWPTTWTGVDAAVRWPNGKAYFFRGSQYLRFDIAAGRVDTGYPKSIAGNWPGLWTSGIEYMLTFATGKAYAFRGTEFQRYDISSGSVDPGYPKPIVGYWPGVPF